jgi:hypothetical protein
MLKTHEILSELMAARRHRPFRKPPDPHPAATARLFQPCKSLKNYTKGQETQM